MAKMIVFAPYDGRLGVYMQPFFMLHRGQAVRSWHDICTDPDSMMAKHPADFVLYELGEFDDVEGVFTQLPQKNQIASALEVVRAHEAQAGIPLSKKSRRATGASVSV